MLLLSRRDARDGVDCARTNQHLDLMSELIVGVGTLALAALTGGLVFVTVWLDWQRRKREVRGIARIVDSELKLITENIEKAVHKRRWWVYDLASPGVAWDRGGGAIAAALTEQEADELIDVVAKLRTWEGVPRRETELSFTLNDADVEFLDPLVPRLSQSREFLRRLGNP
jgi:hypothetical protein